MGWNLLSLRRRAGRHTDKGSERYSVRFTIQPSFAAIRTTGLTSQAAIAATASCIAASEATRSKVSKIMRAANCNSVYFIPSMFPCSVSTHIQSKPDLAMTLAWFVPGSICHAPKVRPEPVRSAFWRRLAACILVSDEDRVGFGEGNNVGEYIVQNTLSANRVKSNWTPLRGTS